MDIENINEKIAGKEISQEALQQLKEKCGEAVISGILLVGPQKGDSISKLLEKIKGNEKLSDEEIEEIMNSSKTSAEDMQSFDIEEAHVYAEGEAEIAKMVEEEKKKHMLLHGGIGGAVGTIVGTATFDEEAIEKECRAKYAKEHPEYKAVMNEGLAVEKEYDDAKNAALSEWEEANPKPERNSLGIILGGVVSEAKYQLELKKWEEKRTEHEKSFQESYAKDNQNYANLKEQQETQEPKKKFYWGANIGGAGGRVLAGATAVGSIIPGLDTALGGITGGISGAFTDEKLADHKDSKEI